MGLKLHANGWPVWRNWRGPAAFAALLCAALPAHAAEQKPTTPLNAKPLPPGTSLAMSLDQIFTYDSNPLKLVNNNQSIYGSQTAAGLLIKYDTPTSTIHSDSSIQQNLYDDSAFDSTNFYELLRLGRRNERWSANLDGRLDYATTRTTEITSFGINAPNIRNTKLAAIPTIGFQYTPRKKISVNARVVKSTYDSSAFQDYDFYGAAPSYLYKIDPRNTATVTWNFQRFESQGASPVTTDTTGPSLGWIWDYDDNLRARFTAGMERSTQTNKRTNRESKQNFSVFSASFTYKAQQYVTNFEASRSQQPSGNGVTYLLTTLALSETYIVNDNLSLMGKLGYRKAAYITQPLVNLDTELSGSGGFVYRMMEDVDVTGNYQYMRQKLTSGNGTLDGHTVLLGVTYHPMDWML